MSTPAQTAAGVPGVPRRMGQREAVPPITAAGPAGQQSVGSRLLSRNPRVRKAFDLRDFGQHVVFGPGGEITERFGLGVVPDRSPFKAGDWVVCHGYPGSFGQRRWGFRGVVLGAISQYHLRGICDDGTHWSESWASLVADGKPCDPVLHCTCCPQTPRPPSKPKAEQLDLFADLGSLESYVPPAGPREAR